MKLVNIFFEICEGSLYASIKGLFYGRYSLC